MYSSLSIKPCRVHFMHYFGTGGYSTGAGKEIIPTNSPIGDMIYSAPELPGVFLRADREPCKGSINLAEIESR